MRELATSGAPAAARPRARRHRQDHRPGGAGPGLARRRRHRHRAGALRGRRPGARRGHQRRRNRRSRGSRRGRPGWRGQLRDAGQAGLVARHRAGRVRAGSRRSTRRPWCSSTRPAWPPPPTWTPPSTTSLARGGCVRLVGDDRQLASVAAGGVLRDIAAPPAPSPSPRSARFSDPAEAAATLALRDGDPAALGFYADRGRIHVGDLAEAPTRPTARGPRTWRPAGAVCCSHRPATSSPS